MKLILLIMTTLAAGIQAFGNDDSTRYAKHHQLPSGQIAVVAEGDFESRSIGSYSVRIYSNENAEYPTDDFLCGLLLPRDGAIESVIFADIDQDGVKDMVVTIRCAGTGSYLSADAFKFKEKQLVKVAAAKGLPKGADCIAELVKVLKSVALKH